MKRTSNSVDVQGYEDMHNYVLNTNTYQRMQTYAKFSFYFTLYLQLTDNIDILA